MKLQFTLDLDRMTSVDAIARSCDSGPGHARLTDDQSQAAALLRKLDRIRSRQLERGSDAGSRDLAETWQTMMEPCCSTTDERD